MTLFAGANSAFARYALVAVERGIEREDGGELSYGIPPAMEQPEAIGVGERVEVPLGRKRVSGVVVSVGGSELIGEFDPAKVRSIAARTGAALSPALLELAKWIAAYYVCPLGMVFASMVPAAVKREIGRASQVVYAVGVFPPDLKGALKKICEHLARADPSVFPLPAADLRALLGERTMRNINRLVAIGALREEKRSVVRVRGDHGAAPATFGADRSVTLSAEQAAVVNGITADSAGERRFGVHLVYGVTGSGKTEVYLRLIREMLQRESDASVIVLVPEISLTPQTSERFAQRFADLGVAVLHSGLSASKRNSEWSRVASGEARVVVGARSAIFAPVPKLGMVVVDEEHDTSYKQDQLPRYHARDVAIKRAQLEGCPVLLGSATPSLESWFNAGAGRLEHEHHRKARFRLWTLRQRVGGGKLPEVRIIDAYAERAEARELGLRDPTLLPTLRRALFATLRAGSQAILLLNRRGFATFVGCAGGQQCGWVMTCDRCDARMILHRNASLRSGELLRCHHCLSESVVPRVCPACSRGLVRLGAGTQRVEEELQPLLTELQLPPDAIARVDRDTMRTARDYFTALGDFAQGKTRLLLGTQMIAKGLDFPGVRLVGVISADTGLHLPDFRASERTFQLISQVAGRAGRADAAGEVIIQTMEPGNPAILHAAAHDYEGFASEEMAVRRAFRLPPVTRMARLMCRDEKLPAVRERAAWLVEWLRSWSNAHRAGLLVRGPVEPPVARIADQFRLGIEIVGESAGLVQQCLLAARAEGLLKSDARTAIDVDPVSLL
ncbi:MAG: primosomal protein N' [Planctomycetes bacterium]|nr:primosomal protein N' [Planctomycetota bacterium]